MGNGTMIDWRNDTSYWARPNDINGLIIEQDDQRFLFDGRVWYCVEYECVWTDEHKLEIYAVRNGTDYLYLSPTEFAELFEFKTFDLCA